MKPLFQRLPLPEAAISVRERFHARPAALWWLAILLAAAVACGDVSGAPDGDADAVIPAVEVVQARAGAVPLEERVNGVVKAHNQVAIRPEVEGLVTEVLVRSGDAVDRGDPLVRIEARSLREQVQQAQANVRLAEARLAELRAQVVRTRSLAAEGLVSELQLETQEAQLAATEATLDQARATLDERRSLLDRTTVRAPIAGRVGSREAEVGMLVDPGSVLFLLGDLARLIVEVPLTDEMLSKVDEGHPVRIDAQALDEPIRAQLSRISPFLATESFSTLGEIDLQNPGGQLRPGMFVAVDLLHGASESATLIPTSAVWDDPGSGQKGAFVVLDAQDLADSPTRQREILAEPRRISFRPLQVVAEGRGISGVRGVDEGEWIVTVGQHLLHEQSRGLDPAENAVPRARVRVTTWENVLQLQRLQREDLLADFLSKQQRLAQALGAEIPESEDVVERILAGDRSPPASGPGAEGSGR